MKGDVNNILFSFHAIFRCYICHFSFFLLEYLIGALLYDRVCHDSLNLVNRSEVLTFWNVFLDSDIFVRSKNIRLFLCSLEV